MDGLGCLHGSARESRGRTLDTRGHRLHALLAPGYVTFVAQVAVIVWFLVASLSSVELDQVLKDQPTPAISARLHQQAAFRKPAKFDRRETKFFRKRTNLRCCGVVVARQEHDSPATMYGRILVKNGSDQMVEALTGRES